MTIEEMWNLLEAMGVNEQALDLITSINGYCTETMEDVLYWYTGFRSFDQL